MAISINKVELYPRSCTVTVHYTAPVPESTQKYSFIYVKKSAGGLTIQSLLRSIEDSLLESGMGLL